MEFHRFQSRVRRRRPKSGYNAGVRPPFQILQHPADVGFLAYGASLEELFQNAALALCLLACEPGSIEAREKREVSARGENLEALLYAWLAEILAVADAEQLVFCRVVVKRLITPAASRRRARSAKSGGIEGILIGEPFDRARHGAGTYIKAVTYHQFALERTGKGWRARVFLDL